jgi:DNA-3-methyladenine glycosylase II
MHERGHKEACSYLSTVDPILSQLINRFGWVSLDANRDHFASLAQSIVSQQLSEKAGQTIWNRLVAKFPNNTLTPELVLEAEHASLRASGISNSKAMYIKNVARAFSENLVKPDSFQYMEDEAVISQLTAIKGIGRWTSEMFLIFSLGREDIFSFGDAGLSRAIHLLYGKGKKLSTKHIDKITRIWSPYRSYASLLLWKSLDNE